MPYFVQMKHPILYALLLSLFAGLFENVGYFLSLSRIIYFFPFFLLGYCSRQNHLKKFFFFIKSRIFGYLAIILSFLLLFFVSRKVEIDYRVLYGSFSYTSLGNMFIPGIILRLANYTIALFFLIIFLNIVPNRKTVLSAIGRNSLYIYLLHGFVVLFFEKTFFKYIPANMTFVIILNALVLTALFSYVFSQKVFADALTYVKYPQIFLEKDTHESKAPSESYEPSLFQFPQSLPEPSDPDLSDRQDLRNQRPPA